MKNPLFFLCLLLLGSCSSFKNEDMSLLSRGDIPSQNITPYFQQVDIPADSIDEPEFILSVENYIVWANSKTDFALSIYNTRTGVFQRIGRKGRASNEILNVNQIGIYSVADQTAFYVHDNYAQKILIYTLDTDRCELWRIEEMNEFRTFDFNRNMIIGVNAEPESRYKLIDTLSGAEIPFGDYSEYELPMAEGAQLYQGFTLANKKRQRCAWFSFYGEACNIIDYHNRDSIGIPYSKTYQRVLFSSADNSPVFSLETKIGFVSLAGNNDRIYALCSDQTLQRVVETNTDPHLAHDICVFNWDGEYLERWIRITRFGVSVGMSRRKKCMPLLSMTTWPAESFPGLRYRKVV